jgi:iron complex transport system ATP-binding protein
MSQPKIISLKGLRFSYTPSGPLVLKDLSLEIPAGAVTAILGPNGSGKTTLLFILLGMLSPQKGEILIDGVDQKGLHRGVRSRLMGLVPEEEHIPFDFSIQEYVLLGRAPHLGLLELPKEIDYRVATEALERAGLSALADRSVPSLSGGERQLAKVARALAQRPRVLLFDEPTAHLDLNNKGRVLDMIRSMADDGVAVVLTTHDPNAATVVADHVVLLRSGQTVATGPVDVVLTSENLTQTYGLPVEVTSVRGRPVVLPW